MLCWPFVVDFSRSFEVLFFSVNQFEDIFCQVMLRLKKYTSPMLVEMKQMSHLRLTIGHRVSGVAPLGIYEYLAGTNSISVLGSFVLILFKGVITNLNIALLNKLVKIISTMVLV